jgi:DNA-binding response OmpR family regulator
LPRGVSRHPEAHAVFGQPKVLLLDDEAVIRGSLSRYLEGAGFDVRSTATTEDALAVLDAGTIHAAVLDVRLPGHRSGLEVLEAMRLRDGLLPGPIVIVLTGHDLAPDEEEIIRRNRAYVFYKPHGYDDLVARLNELLSSTS